MSVMEWITAIAFLVCAAGSVLFTILYLSISDWKATRAGKALALLSTLISVVFVYVILRGLFGLDLGWRYLGAVLYTGLAASFWHWIWIVLKAERRKKNGTHTGSS